MIKVVSDLLLPKLFKQLSRRCLPFCPFSNFLYSINICTPSPPQHREESLVAVGHLVYAIGSCVSISHCRAIHARAVKSINFKDGFMGDQLVSVYFKLGSEEEAQKLFDEMPGKDLASWNSLISWFSKKGYVDKCLIAFIKMRLDVGVEPNEVTLMSIISACSGKGALDEGKSIHGFALKSGGLLEAKVANCLIKMYGNSGLLDSAVCLFGEMLVRTSVSWNLVIMVHSLNRYFNGGIGFFNMMRKNGVKPDQATMVNLLRLCEDLGLGSQTETVHGCILRSGFSEDITIATLMVKLYSKLGRLDASHKVFGEMKNPDQIAWTAMLSGYAIHGCGIEAIKLFDYMILGGVDPDHVTFTHLLNACSHSGLVKEGKRYFEIMERVFGVVPRLDHYSCMVDLMGRSGLLNDAYELIMSMPMQPNSAVWGPLLGACRVHGNVELGKEAAENLISIEPSDPRNYIMLSNIYSSAGIWKEASRARGLMKEKRLVRSPGFSSIEHGNTIHRFLVGDRSHPESEKIYLKLEEIMMKLREIGYVSRTEFVLHDVEEEVKEDMVNMHSEKLAIAYGLLVTSPSVPIIVTKNLRICGDCHSTAKLISLIEKRNVVIRDSKRFHHFANGLCSCRDYW